MANNGGDQPNLFVSSFAKAKMSDGIGSLLAPSDGGILIKLECGLSPNPQHLDWPNRLRVETTRVPLRQIGFQTRTPPRVICRLSLARHRRTLATTMPSEFYYLENWAPRFAI